MLKDLDRWGGQSLEIRVVSKKGVVTDEGLIEKRKLALSNGKME
jgi:hypothetical protein